MMMMMMMIMVVIYIIWCQPHRRLGAWHGLNSIAKHPWLEGVDWDALDEQEVVAPIIPEQGSIVYVDEKDSQKKQLIANHFLAEPISPTKEHHFKK